MSEKTSHSDKIKYYSDLDNRLRQYMEKLLREEVKDFLSSFKKFSLNLRNFVNQIKLKIFVYNLNISIMKSIQRRSSLKLRLLHFK